MKRKITAMCALLILMAALPLFAVQCVNREEKPSVSAKQSENNSDKGFKTLCGMIAAQYSDDLTPEALKALAIIINTNLKSDKSSFDLNDKSVCLYEADAQGEVKKAYSEIKKSAKQAQNTVITYKGKAVKIPFSKKSSGTTSADPDCEYLCPVASPWDSLINGGNEQSECKGVSVSGINYLCENGESAEQALRWYLPLCDVNNS